MADRMRMTGSCLFRFSGARGFDYLIDLPRGQLVGSLALRFLADNPKDFGLRSGEADTIPDTYCLSRAAFLDNDRAALILNAAQKLAEMCAGPQCGHDYRFPFSVSAPRPRLMAYPNTQSPSR
jgi:hypothetical protein